MSTIILEDDDFDYRIHVSEEDDEELFDLLNHLLDAFEGGESYAHAINNVIGGFPDAPKYNE